MHKLTIFSIARAVPGMISLYIDRLQGKHMDTPSTKHQSPLQISKSMGPINDKRKKNESPRKERLPVRCRFGLDNTAESCQDLFQQQQQNLKNRKWCAVHYYSR